MNNASGKESGCYFALLRYGMLHTSPTEIGEETARRIMNLDSVRYGASIWKSIGAEIIANGRGEPILDLPHNDAYLPHHLKEKSDGRHGDSHSFLASLA